MEDEAHAPEEDAVVPPPPWCRRLRVFAFDPSLTAQFETTTARQSTEVQDRRTIPAMLSLVFSVGHAEDC